MADEELAGRGMTRGKGGDTGDVEDLLIGAYVVLDLRKLDNVFDSVDALLL